MAGPGSPRKDALKQERLGVEGSLGVFYTHPGLLKNSLVFLCTFVAVQLPSHVQIFMTP